MDVVARALLDLGEVNDARPEQVENRRYIEFKQRVGALLKRAFTTDAEVDRFLEEYFLSFLPVLLRAAAEYEGLADVRCDEERALVEEVMAEKSDLLGHSPIFFPLNRKSFQDIDHQRPALDLGIGNGRSSQYCLSDRELDVGADIIVSNLIKAKSRRSHHQYYALDMASLPFQSGSFRTVYALNCIYHVQGGRSAGISEMMRVLAPGGVLALTDVSSHLNELKPLESFFSSLGFNALAQDFTEYFLSGYGADGSTGDPVWYRSFLEQHGMVDVQINYLMSSCLTRLSYLFYDWQALFNFDALRRLENDTTGNRYENAYRPMLLSLVAPLIKLDRQLCQQEGKGGYLFITARKAGQADHVSGERLICPECKSPLPELLRCPTCEREYPQVNGIPLLTTFFADAVLAPKG